MKISYYSQPNYLTRTAIVREQKQFIKIAFAVHLSAVISAERYRSDSGALKSAVPILVYFYIIMINKYRQSAKRKLLLNSPTDRTFENRHVGCKEREKINRRRTLCTLRINFFEATPQTAYIFSKETVKNGNRVYSIKEYEVDTAPHARIKKETNTIRENYNEIKTESEYEYDKYGNVTKLYDKGDVINTNDDIIAEITYWKGASEDKYFKAHPEKIHVLHGKTGTLLRKREGAYDSRTGALTELKQYTSHGAYLVNRIEWTEEGNIKAVTSPTGKRAEYKYLDGIYPIEIKELSSKGDKSYTSKIEWDRILGVKLKETDAANNTMSYKYDNLARVTEVRSPYDTSETPYAKYTYITPKDSYWYTVTENKISTEAEDEKVMKTIVLHDGLGRISYTAKEGEVYVDGTADQTQTGWNISSAINYDEAGRKIEEGMPFFYGGDLEQELVNKNSYEALESFYELNNFTTIRNGTKYEYDDIDRNILTTLPDGHTQRNEYSIDASLQITKATDPLENISISKKDARGNIREVERLDQTNTLLTKARYEYSVLGEMLRAYDAKNNLLSVTYDLLGRRTALESKDTGKKEWIYDDKGRLQAETDSVLKNKAAEIRYEYDGFDRILKIDYPFSQDIEYKYGAHGQNGAGQIVYKKDETGETHYTYGNLNEVVSETRTINRYGAGSSPETASFEYRSDYLGRMQSMKYPDGEKITYTYDKGGQLRGVSGVKTTNKGKAEYSYVDKILYDEHAQRVYIKYGNGVETRYKYDEKRRWLDTIETKNVQTQDVFQKIKYSFDPVGNVLGYNNDASTYETQQTYSYDSLYQLISVEGTSNQYKGKKSFGMTPVSIAKYKQTFSFDAIGNMKEKLSTTNIPGAQGNSYPKAELDYNLDYEYDPAYAHRLIRAGNRYYRYDANGNITAEKDGPFTDEEEFVFTYSYFENEDVYGADYGFGLDAPKETEQSNPQDLFAYRRNYTWNERNLLTKSSDKNYTVHYRYGEDGQRALKYTDEGRSETLYFNNFFTIHIPTQDQNNPQGLRVHKHIFVGNSRLVTAMTHTDNKGDNDEQKAKRYYYHSDNLGSAQFVTDWKGRQYEHIEYTPYGELWIEEVAAGLDKLPFRFTGKELDEETGLYYYGARYLDPKYSRWLSGDPALNDYIPKAPINDEAKKHNENLPGMGGVFNVVNLHVYHYAGNNPVKYTDPDGKSGKLTIYSTGNSLMGGHAWISYTPDDTGVTTTYGTWGNNPTGKGNGLFENLEQNRGAEATRSVHLDDNQERALLKTINDYKEKGKGAWKLFGPCSKFAQDAWDSATGEYLNANTLIIINNPETLKKSIIKANGNVANGTLEMPNSSSGASSTGSNSVDRSSGSSSYGVGSTSNVSLDPIYNSLAE
ncbi:RHS repeat domain-containing protein [Treponema sp. OMZ 787]|uniref:RHS repeat domain-containing protein n=1 Tax=Treponema sp. OMZ 787 TaxID=2563669 RepID=UPI00273A6162|nr:RHS repeat-associated core domain-containing protein [Treponema sp. OMZ 787]